LTGSACDGIGRVIGGVDGAIVIGINDVAIAGVALIVSSFLLVGEGVTSHASLSAIS